jgi:hypothetical protein
MTAIVKGTHDDRHCSFQMQMFQANLKPS